MSVFLSDLLDFPQNLLILLQSPFELINFLFGILQLHQSIFGLLRGFFTINNFLLDSFQFQLKVFILFGLLFNTEFQIFNDDIFFSDHPFIVFACFLFTFIQVFQFLQLFLQSLKLFLNFNLFFLGRFVILLDSFAIIPNQ